MNESPTPNLYGETPGSAPVQAAPQSVWDQLVGVFTEPTKVFQHLRLSPAWVGALILVIGTALFASLVWAAKVDMEAVVKHQMEVMEQAFHMAIPADAMDKAMEQAATSGQPILKSALGIIFITPLIFLVMAGILYGFTRFGGTDEEVTFKHAWAATVVHGLSMVPIALLAGIVCLVRPVGGAASYASLAPSNPGFWMHLENPWLRGLVGIFDPFYLFSFVVLFLAARHTLRLKTWAAALVVGLMGFFGFLFHFFNGLFS
ncbi:MAG: YIP1 family protein [Firmicutes bacterium]|nr:YIP1 family protein [Bacillota bacterium]